MARRTATLVATTTAAMAAAEDLDLALQALLAGVCDLTGAECGGVRILKECDQVLGWCRLYFWEGGEDFTWREVENLPGSNTVQALTTGRGIYSSDLPARAATGDRSAQAASERDQLGSSLIVPLRVGGQVIGSLHADARRPRAFSRALLLPLQILADHAAGAVARAQLSEKEQATQRHLLLALQTSGTITFSCDTLGRLESVTGDVRVLLGRSNEAIVGQRLLDLIHPSVRAVIAAALVDWGQGRQETLRVETLLWHASGSSVPALVVLGARLEQGQVVGGIGAIADLSRVRGLESELTKALTDLAKREASLAAAQEIAHLGHWEWDLATERRWWSDELFRIFGLPLRPEAPSFEVFLQMVHPDHRREVEATIRAAQEDNQSVALEFRIVRPDGSERWLQIRGEVQLGRWGKAQRIVSTILDITERKQAELMLEQQYHEAEAARGELRAILDTTGEAMLLLALDGRVLSANRRVETLFQISEAALRRLSTSAVHDVCLKLFEDAALCQKLLAYRDDPYERFQYELKQRWPRERDLLLESAPVQTSAEQLLGRLFAFRDVTSERMADRMKDEIISFVSHELRTPLTSIKGYVDLLLEGELGMLSSDQQEFLRIIQQSTNREVSLINDLLDISRLESGKTALDFSLIALVPLLEQLVAAFRPQIMAKQQRIVLDLSDRLPPIVADASRLTQVFTNLISNAHKYTPTSGQITLRAWQENGRVLVSVADSGIGMSEEEQAQLFTKFFRARNRMAQNEGGTGLGLVISRQLVELHGGQITVTSAPGQGSTFTVSLPIQPEGADSGATAV
ncbi:MAG: ATP-binding protein [Chloroflexi bacterium]|nr:ATP-binding protein [Chloroflexota bacterium]